MLRRCPKCQTEKEVEQFGKDRSTSSGLTTWCKDCVRVKNARAYAVHGDSIREQAKKWARSNPDRHKAKCRISYETNRSDRIARAREREEAHPERKKVYRRRAYLKRPEYYAQVSLERRLRVVGAMPSWVDKKALRAFYREARRLTRSTGVPHEVDHIHPITHPLSCGLHVPWNLQILTRRANRQKGNRLTLAA